VARGEAHLAALAADVLPAGESRDGAPDAAPGGADAIGEGEERVQPQHVAATKVRASDAEPDVAERHLHVSAGRALRVPGGVHGRLLALPRGGGTLPQPDGGGGHRSLPRGGGGVPAAEGDAHRPWSAIHQLAWQEPLREGDAEGADHPHQESGAASDDAGESGALLVDDLDGVPVASAVRELRECAGAHSGVGEALQPQAAQPGHRGDVSRGSLL